MMAIILDGKKLSESIKINVKEEIAQLYQKTKHRPKLCVVLVGDNTASQTYVGSKENACKNVGIESETFRYSTMNQLELESLIMKLNKDKSVNGILVQLPLPKNLDEEKIIDMLDPMKDVDGFHPFNTGKLWINCKPHFFPCTPWGIYTIIKEYKINLSGKQVVIIGRSNIVGKPMAGILSQKIPFADATVTICNSKTENLDSFLQRADLIVAAIGKPEYIKAGMVKKGVVIIDVGINRVEDKTCAKGYRIVGDVNFNDVLEKASYITPVPGGVGPMTIAVLLQNTIKAFKLQNNIE